MSTWEPQRLAEVVQQIDNNEFVLPVIQRRLVWTEEKMELLFDSLLKRNSFGGIMVFKEDIGDRPLFAFRNFSRDGEEHSAVAHDKLMKTIRLVIDGQQRLQAFYMGLKGSLDGKALYFNLIGTRLEYEFKFAGDPSELPLTETDDQGQSVEKLWYLVKDLFNELRESHDSNYVAERVIKVHGVTDEGQRYQLRHNIGQFYQIVFSIPTIGISTVIINKTYEDDEKQRIVELFRRLNDGGTRLSSFDLVASVFKGFDYRMEQFFKDSHQFETLGISQDEVIKLLFLLQDAPTKEVAQIKQEDADFAIANRDRIMATLQGVEQFLRYADLYDYYRGSNRSVIPLYFIAYHLFHKSDIDDAGLIKLYDNYDTNNPDFICLKRWLYLSVLNGVFSRGRGWIPYRTGIRKILQLMKGYKGHQFPDHELFQLYTNHPLRFSTAISPENLEMWDRDFIFYLIYDYQSITGRDVDHIHPKSLLQAALDAQGEQPQFQYSQIHSTANYQLLDVGTNRGAKQGKALHAWLENDVTVLDSYLDKHLIPTDPHLWSVEQFPEFHRARARLITDRIQASIPAAIAPPVPPPSPAPAPAVVKQPEAGPDRTEVDKEALRQQLPPEYRDHPILSNQKTWHAFYKQAGCGPVWTSRYNKELRSANIETLADFALFIMVCNLEFANKATHGDNYRFHHPTPSGYIPSLKTNPFGGWGWKVALRELKDQGFNWQEFVVSDKSTGDIDKEALRQQLSPEYRDHPILSNQKTWHAFYKQAGCGPVWTSRYNKELRSANIETLADFALFIMVCNLEFVNKATHGNNYRFHHATPSGYVPSLKTTPFGGWGWKVALRELKDQGFNWQEFLVNDK